VVRSSEAATLPPVAGVRVAMSDGRYGASTDDSGKYTIYNIAAGGYTVVAAKLGYNPASLYVSVHGGVYTANFTITRAIGTATISGTVRSTAGVGVAGVTVAGNGYSATTDANGNYTLYNLPAGRYTLVASKTGYNDGNRAGILLSGGQGMAGLDFTLIAQAGYGNITGVVRDSSGHSVSSAMVSGGGFSTLTSRDHYDEHHHTDWGGTYTMSVPEGTYTFSVTKSGYTTVIQTVTIKAGMTTTVNFTLAPNSTTGTLVAMVHDAEGYPIVGAAALTFPNGYTATSDANGAFVIANMAPGNYAITVSKSGFSPSTISAIAFVAGRTVTLDFTLFSPSPSSGTGTISGKVTDTAGPLFGALISAATSGSASSYSAVSDASGNYSIYSVPAGNYTVTASMSGHTNVAKTGIVVSPLVITQGVNFTLPVVSSTTGGISGTVKTADGVLAGATVKVDGKTFTTGADGKYTVYDLTPGAWLVTATKTDYSTASQTVQVTAGQTVIAADLNISLLPATITGQVLSGSTPVAGATVSGSGMSATTDASGVFTIGSVRQSAYILTASKSGFTSDSWSGVVLANRTATADFAVTSIANSGSISGVVKSASGSLLSGATVTCGGLTSTTGADGAYRFSSLGVGSYTVGASAAGYTSGSQVVPVAGGINTTCDFALALVPTTGSVSGVVKSASGSLVQGATVTCGTLTYTTAADGAYSFSALAPGTYTVSVTAGGYLPASKSAAVAAGANTGCDFALTPATGSVSGVVKSAAGALVSGATVTCGGLTFTTGADGAYSFASLPAPATYGVSVSAAGYFSASQSVPVAIGANSLANFALSPQTGSVSGVVRNAAGSLISGATVTCNGASFTTGANGAYSFASLPAGTYSVQAAATGYTTAVQSVPVTAGQNTIAPDFALAASAGTITGTVKDSLGAVVAGVSISSSTGGYTATTNSSGVYTISSVAAGSYTLTAAKASFASATSPVTVQAGQSATANFTMTATNLAKSKTATARSYRSGYPASNAVDGNTSTYWYSNGTQNSQYLQVDLASAQTISRVLVNWGSYYGRSYNVQTSTNGSSWTTVFTTTSGATGAKTITFTAASARYVKVNCTTSSSSNGFQIKELEVYAQ
jgi:large repetitive protein